MQAYCDGSITNVWSLKGFINDLPLPCRRIKKTSVQVVRIRPVHSLITFQYSPNVNFHPILQ